MSEELDRLRAMIEPDQETWDLTVNDVKAIRWAIRQIEADHNAKNAMLEAINNLNARLAIGPTTARMLKHVARLRGEPAGGAVFIAVAQNIQDDAEPFMAELRARSAKGDD